MSHSFSLHPLILPRCFSSPPGLTLSEWHWLTFGSLVLMLHLWASGKD